LEWSPARFWPEVLVSGEWRLELKHGFAVFVSDEKDVCERREGFGKKQRVKLGLNLNEDRR
jgi:hypothetical protein